MLHRNLGIVVCALALCAGAGCVTQSAFDSHLEEFAATREQVSALRASTASLEEQRAALEEQFAALEQEMAALRSHVAERLERAEAQMGESLAGVEALRRELGRMAEEARETALAQRALIDSVLARIGGLTEEQEAARELLRAAQDRVRKMIEAQREMAQQQAEHLDVLLENFAEEE